MGNKKKDVIVVVVVDNPQSINQSNYKQHITFYDTRNDVQALGDPTSYITHVDPDRSISWCAIIGDPQLFPDWRVRLSYLNEKPGGGSSILKNLPLTDSNEDGILVGKTNSNVTANEEESYLITLMVYDPRSQGWNNIEIDPKLKGNP